MYIGLLLFPLDLFAFLPHVAIARRNTSLANCYGRPNDVFPVRPKSFSTIVSVSHNSRNRNG